MKIFDPHIRSRTQGDDDLKNLHYFGTDTVVTTAHGERRFEDAADLVRYFESLMGDERRRLRRCGIKAYAALGVLPNARPRRAHYEVYEALSRLLERPEVVALGEVGVWDDSEEDWELFERQITIAKQVGPLPVIVTPPKNLRLTLTYKMMTRLKWLSYPPSLVVMNYLDGRMVKNVVDSGFCAGVPVGVNSNDPRAAVRFLEPLLADPSTARRILLTSALRHGGGDILGVPKTVEALEKAGVSSEAIQNLVYGNASRLFESTANANDGEVDDDR